MSCLVKRGHRAANSITIINISLETVLGRCRNEFPPYLVVWLTSNELEINNTINTFLKYNLKIFKPPPK